jgi:hypothetical protein
VGLGVVPARKTIAGLSARLNKCEDHPDGSRLLLDPGLGAVAAGAALNERRPGPSVIRIYVIRAS